MMNDFPEWASVLCFHETLKLVDVRVKFLLDADQILVNVFVQKKSNNSSYLERKASFNLSSASPCY